jgi:flagellar basal body L-ring protein FlgH
VETVNGKATNGGVSITCNDARKSIGTYGRINTRRTSSVSAYVRQSDRTTIARGIAMEQNEHMILSLMFTAKHGAAPAQSLFSANAPDLFLYRDVKARNVGDILTIQVIENASATNSATTATQKKGDVSLSAPALAGLEHGNSAMNFSNILQAAGGLNFNGTGSTTRSGQLQAEISARVVQVFRTEIFGSKEPKSSPSTVSAKR